MFGKKTLTLIMAGLCACTVIISPVSADNSNLTARKKPAKQVQKVEPKKSVPVEKKNSEDFSAYESKCSLVDEMDLVNDPDKFLNKYIVLNALFDKYTTLGLDYKPAMRSSKDFISFLIRRDNTKNQKNIIPLSELKLIIARKTAEKYTSLEPGDEIRIYGQVFSSSLGDPWVEVNHISSSKKDISAPLKELEGASGLDE